MGHAFDLQELERLVASADPAEQEAA
jgi:hypothetical protein